MLHSRAEPETPGPFSRVELARDFTELGLAPGDTVMVHASVGSVGWISGGAVALFQALRDAVGPRGTVVVPAFTTYLSDPASWVRRSVPRQWWPAVRASLPPFDPDLHAAQPGLGRFPEVVRSAAGRVRSAHPVYSLAAAGAGAGPLLAEHPLDWGLGADSPLVGLLTVRAKVLLLGVGWDKCTLLHLSEHLTPYPGRRAHHLSVPVDDTGVTRWVESRQLVFYEGDFPAIGAHAERHGAVRRGLVGRATARLCDAVSLVSAANDWLREHRDLTHAVLPDYLREVAPAPAEPV